ncbi:hypothetical protein PSEUBRA_004366 [Kalmanozyma brasiliensis GHG001]|uniref:Uncharacterized protein n=1 Tax=Kalmanozyma brasiliensis (strain GHG001) TaxID=1365824 RepID=V5E819_KALBG|nr:uncharacterized protein PSEUBRA_004366 [Kalmanozyma brasiliensis GHG001]EST06466.1 hypothetical protein PSEUBRA_004366 [Kalmanozyma brasiliensis GHG001]
MTMSNAAKIAFIGLNALRLVSLVTVILVFTTLVMGLVEDIRDYHNDAIMDSAQADDCAYVPGTSIPMQTWGIFWVEIHRALLMLGVISLFLAELSWLGISRLESAARVWVPVLSRTHGLAALGAVQVVVATSILSHYLDVFPLVVSWMLFVIGILYLALGLIFHAYSLKDGRSFYSTNRKRFIENRAKGHVYRSFSEKGYGATTSTDKPAATMRKLFKRKKPAVSIHETFPSLEAESHKQVLAERARRMEHARKTSAVTIDMNGDADRSSITRDFVWNARAGVVHELSQAREEGEWEMRHVANARRDSEQSCSAASVASSTQIRIGGYTSSEAARARERARARRAALTADSGRSHPPPAKSTGQSGKAANKVKAVKRRSMALVNTARNRLSAGTASALAARRRAPSRGIPNPENEIVIEYMNDDATVPPVPPLPAYQRAVKPGEEVELPVASRFARAHVV